MRPLLSSAVVFAAFGAGCLPGVFLLDAAGQCGSTGVLDVTVEVRNPEELAGLQGCREVRESVSLSGSAITTLAPLASLERVEGALTISETAVTSLAGLEALQVAGQIVLQDNAELAELAGIGPVRGGEEGFALSIIGSPALQDLSGLAEATPTKLTVSGNAGLTTLDGLNGAMSDIGDVTIEGNPSLTDLSGLAALTDAGIVVIRDNDALIDVSELPRSAAAIRLENNDALSSLAGAGPFTLQLSLSISGNAALTSISGIGALAAEGLDITGNVNLVEIDLDDVSLSAEVGVIDNPALSSFTVGSFSRGMRGFLSVGGNEQLEVVSVPGLPSVRGLNVSNNAALGDFDVPDLTSIGDLGFSMRNNDSLETLQGLSSLGSVGGFFVLEGNARLSSLAGLNALRTVAEDVVVRDNPRLSTCEVEAFATRVGDPCRPDSCGGNGGC